MGFVNIWTKKATTTNKSPESLMEFTKICMTFKAGRIHLLT